MRLSHKLGKLINADSWQSARSAIRRLTYPLPTAPFLAEVDRSKIDAIRARHYERSVGAKKAKFLDLDDWMRRNVKRVRNQGIRRSPPSLRVLDIGSGAGYFLHILRCMGHEPLGLDTDDEPIYREMFEAFGLPRVIHRIEAFEPLPDLGAPFDLVTAHLTCFDHRADGSHWGREEWDYFLNDLGRHVKPDGKVQFDLNALPDGRHMEDDLRAYFLSKGARIDRRKVYFDRPPAPSTARKT